MSGEECPLCGGSGAEPVDIADADGAVGAFVCPGCFYQLRNDAGCSICGSSVGGEYSVIFDQSAHTTPHYPLCSTCRNVWIMGDHAAVSSRFDALNITRFNGEPSNKREYDDHGNPIPEPTDQCDVCGRFRENHPEGFHPEIMEPFGEVEYLCGICRANGRGMK